MVLSTLHLQNFRNFKKRSFEFSPRVTVIVGPNTSGKTNILEAIYLLATGKSFRAEVEKEVISWSEEIARISGELMDAQAEDVVAAEVAHEISLDPLLAGDKALYSPSSQRRRLGSDQREIYGLPAANFYLKLGGKENRNSRSFSQGVGKKELEVVITTGQIAGKKGPKKQFLVNGVKKRLIDFLGNFFAVLFSPQDLELITNSPTLRRKYLDSVLGPVDKEYRRAILVYEKALRQRNRLLEMIREKRVNPGQLEYWDKLLIENGKVMTQEREEFIKFANNQPPFLEEMLTDFKLVYEKNEINNERLEEKREKEVLLGMTLVGPHRDDFIVTLHVTGYKLQDARRDLSVYGSRGEQRLAVLWLKLCELAFLEEKTSQKPVLLLDDIFSELDQDYRELVTRIIPNQQTIITTTEREVIKGDFLKEVKTIKLGL